MTMVQERSVSEGLYLKSHWSLSGRSRTSETPARVGRKLYCSPGVGPLRDDRLRSADGEFGSKRG